jgi:GT2 family glycosyltransferase
LKHNKVIVSVLLAYTNEDHLIDNCIKCININANSVAIEVVIVNQGDNGSLHNLSRRYRNVQVIELNKSVGFGESINIASKASSGEYLYITTPGSFVVEGIFDLYINSFKDYSQSIKIGLMGSFINLKKLDGTVYLHRGYLPFKVLSRDIHNKFRWLLYKVTYFDYIYRIIRNINSNDMLNDATEPASGIVDGYIYGGNMFLSKYVFDKFCGFDNDFYLYSEEVELQNRMLKQGYNNIIVGEVLLDRQSGSSFKNMHKNNSRTIYRDIGTLKYYDKTSGALHKYIFKYSLLLILTINVFIDIYRREFTIKMNIRHIKMVFLEKYGVSGK